MTKLCDDHAWAGEGSCPKCDEFCAGLVPPCKQEALDKWVQAKGISLGSAWHRELVHILGLRPAQPLRECLQQSAVDEAVTLLHKYKGLCVTANRGDMYHLKRIEDAAAALQAAPPAPTAVAVPSLASRVRPGVEAAPWVCDAIMKLETELTRLRASLAAAPAQEHATLLAGQGQDETMQALSDLTNALRERHHGRMPEEVQRAYDKAWAIVFAGQHAASPAQGEDVQPATAEPVHANPWGVFLEARTRAIHDFRAHGRTFADIAELLSLENAAHVQRIFEATKGGA